jgi:uncharacterized protein YbjQ (UPF0145 family)
MFLAVRSSFIRHVQPPGSCSCRSVANWYNKSNYLEKRGGLEMIVTTTPSVEGRRILEYKGIVFGEVISGVNFLKDLAAGLTNFFGGRSGSYEGELIQAREAALREMESRAAKLGANAVVGVDIDYEVLGQGGNMLMVTASGTAVVVE